MSEHDPLCECAIPTHYCGNYWAGMSCTRCDCAKVRRVRVAVAEEIAQAIEGLPGLLTWQGDETALIWRERASAEARRIGGAS